MSFRTSQQNFSRGELAPHLYGRFDVDAWQSALKQARNVCVLKYGGVAKRPGTEFVAEVIDMTGPNRLIAFQFSLTQAYALEFGETYMALCVDGGRVLDGGSPYVCTSPYAAVDLAELDHEQSADTVYLAHLSYAPTKLLRHAHTNWEFVAMTFGPTLAAPATCNAVATIDNQDYNNNYENYFPQPATYVVTAVSDDLGQESRASPGSTCTNDLTLKQNYNTITFAAVTGANRYNVYKADNSQFYGYIGTTQSTTFRDDNIGPALDKAPPQAFNPFPGAGDYPSTVTLFEQRSLWGRSSNTPHGIWGSRSGQLENMDRSQPLRADDSFSLAIQAGRVNAVNNLASTTSLIALTSDAVFTIDGDGQGGVITANSTPSVKRQIGRAASRLNPLIIDNVVFYRPATGSAVRTINYAFDIDGLKSNDITIFSPHFFEGFDIVSWCYALEPRSLVWAVRSDGKLLCFTWEQDQNVWGWTLCETDGLVQSVCSISEGGEDRVYLIVERVIDGATKRFVERMASHWWSDVTDCMFLDCAVSGAFDPPQSTFTGLDHLEGATVSGLVDGAVVEGLVVTGGSVTLPAAYPAATKAVFGLPYQVDVKTLPYRVNMPGEGSNVGRTHGIGEAVLTLRNTRSIMVGIDETHLFPVKSRTTEAYASPDELMNGEYTFHADNAVRDGAEVHVRQTAPLPLTILGVAYDPQVWG